MLFRSWALKAERSREYAAATKPIKGVTKVKTETGDMFDDEASD